MPAAFLTDALPPASAWNWCFIGMLPTREHPSEWIGMTASVNPPWERTCMDPAANYVLPLGHTARADGVTGWKAFS